MARYRVELEERMIRTRTVDVIAKNKTQAREKALEAYEMEPDDGEIVGERVQRVTPAGAHDLDLPPEEDQIFGDPEDL